MKYCLQCKTQFEVTDVAHEFYQKFQVPDPTLCPSCRRQRRLAWRNERHLFQRTCDLCKGRTLSIYLPDAPFPVYCIRCWWSDRWDPLTYGRDFDFKRSFFDQYAELQKKVPRMALMQSQTENSEYTNYVSHLKDCYLLCSSDFNQSCFYGFWIERSKDCVDNLLIDACQLTYENIFAQNCFNTRFTYFSSDCSDSTFLFDCKSCRHCFMCHGLRNKEYYIANQPYSKEDYCKKLEEFPLSSYANLEKAKNVFWGLIQKAKYPPMRQRGTVIDSTGDFLNNVTNCKECYEVTEARDCRFILGGFEIKDVWDGCYVGQGELAYENCECVPVPFRSIGNVNSYSGSDLFYCDTCMNNCSSLLGCISLKHKKHCILNKQYSKEQYFNLQSLIINHMRATGPALSKAGQGEWGEFFPINLSPFAYNECEAFQDFPLTQKECSKRGYRWHEKDQRDYQPQAYSIPDDIKEVLDSITNETLACVSCGKNFKIIIQELKFYRLSKLPIPRKCPYCRHKARFELRNRRTLYDRKCMKCGVPVKTTYPPDSAWMVYCEKCYQESLA